MDVTQSYKHVAAVILRLCVCINATLDSNHRLMFTMLYLRDWRTGNLVNALALRQILIYENQVCYIDLEFTK